MLADRLTGTFGLRWEARDRGADRNPQWEIAGVSEELIREFSSRTREIEKEKDRLIEEYVERHGRQPSRATIVQLRAQATLATRPEKQVRSLADLTGEWRRRAGRLIGGDAGRWAARAVSSAGVPEVIDVAGRSARPDSRGGQASGGRGEHQTVDLAPLEPLGVRLEADDGVALPVRQQTGRQSSD